MPTKDFLDDAKPVQEDFLADATPYQETDDRNAIQRGFDKLTTVTPEQEAGHSGLVNKMQEFGAGAIQGLGQPFIHPLDTLGGLVNTVAHPLDTASAMGSGLKEHPAQFAGNLVGGAVLGLGGKAAGSAGLKVIPSAARTAIEPLSQLNQKYNPLPLRSRAVNTFKSVAKDAADVPVEFDNTIQALDEFRQSVATGGKSSPVMNKLGRRIDGLPEQGQSGPWQQGKAPVNFPEARDFYKNVTRASAKPGFLRRQLESPAMPDLRRNIGGVREAMDTDLTKAAESVGRGADYQQGLKEYANNAKLRRYGRIGLGLAGAEAARRTGLAGRVAGKLVGE